MTGGEYLPDDLRRRLSEAFGCYVQTSYACTEAGNVACDTAAIKSYIANQLKEDHDMDQLNLFDPRDPFTGSK